MINVLPNLGEGINTVFSETKPLSVRASNWREFLKTNPTPKEFDELIFPKTNDPYSYSSEKLIQKIIEYRNDIRELTYSIFYTPAPDLAENFIIWSLSFDEPSKDIKDSYLNFLKEDSLYLLSHGFNNINVSYDHIPKKINDRISETIIEAKRRKRNYFLSSPATLEASWLIACNPVSSDNNFEMFGPNDPQWFTVLAHPNFPVDKMFKILEQLFEENQKTISDMGYADAIFKNPKWNEHTIEALYLESPEKIRPKIVPYILEHPQCPVFLLDKFFQDLGVDGKIRFAQTTKNSDRLIELSEEENSEIHKVVAKNPYTPEHVAVQIALEISQ